MEKEPTSSDILEAINVFSEKIDGELKGIRKEMTQMRAEMATKDELAKVRAEVATKDFVDRRFNQLDAKIGTLTNTLEKKDVITKDEAHNIGIAS